MKNKKIFSLIISFFVIVIIITAMFYSGLFNPKDLQVRAIDTYATTESVSSLSDNINDFRILSENFISASISSKLALSLSFRLRYDSQPPDNIKNFDTNSSMGITVKL